MNGMKQQKYTLFFMMLLMMLNERVCMSPLKTSAPINELETAFQALTSITRPGVYHSQVRGYMTGGGLQVHFPSYAVDWVSLSPPHYSAGCNGIDLHLGGLSYISGKQFILLLKGIAANTMGYSFGLAMRTLCPVCATTVGQLQKVAQAANQFSIKQCQFSMGLVNTLTSQQANTHITGLAALESAQSGKTADFIAGISDIGSSLSKALNALAKPLNYLQNKGSQQQALQSTGLGSETWKLLSGLDRAQKLFIQSLLGTTVRYPYPHENPKTIRVVPIAATINEKQLIDLFMYGVNAKNPNNGQLWVNDCLTDKSISHSRINRLLSLHDAALCQNVVKKRITESSWYQASQNSIKGVSLAREGFFGLTYALLSQALANMAQGQPLGTPAHIKLPEAIYGLDKNHELDVSFTKKDIEAFISIAPLPLYRAINIAAIDPSMAHALIDNIAEIVAAHYTTAYLEQTLLNTQKQGNHNAGLIGLSPDKLIQLTQALSRIRQHLHQQVKVLMTHHQAAALWAKQVNTLHEKLYGDLIHTLNKNF